MKKLFFVLSVLLIVLMGCTSQPASTPTPIPPTSAPQPTSTPVPIPPTSAPTSTPVPPAAAYTVEVTKDVAYTRPLQPDVPAQKLDVYAPTEPGPWPVVVVLHAYYCTKETLVYATLGKELAGRGAVVFVPTWSSSPSLEATKNNGLLFREASEELSCAVRYARAKATDYGGNPEWVTIFGHAGGQAAEIVQALAGDDSPAWEEFASSRGGPPPQVECVVTGVPAQADAFVEYAGLYTVIEFLKEQDPGLWELCSPWANIGKNPGLVVRLVHGELDQVTSVEKVTQFHEALVGAGYDATLTLVKEGQTQVPWSGPDREELIQVIMEAAQR
jgi:acetyl esterase/lipase